MDSETIRMTCIDVTLPPLNKDHPMVLVAAALLIDDQNRVLLAQRPAGKSMAGLWEFPGGKVEAGELPEIALVRELREELGIETSPGCLLPLTFASHAYAKFHLLMPLFACRVWSGTPHPREGQSLAWATKHEWRNYPMPPADDRILPILFELI
jgi:8-oxo-dGTP diphosphatase